MAVARVGPRVSHLLFVDDTLVFCVATVEEIDVVRWILRLYAQASSKEINLQKFSMAINGDVSGAVKHFFGALLGVQVVSRHDKYLGLLVLGGRSQRMLFKNIRDRLQERIDGWNTKMLS